MFPGLSVIDLGCAPGGWLQIASQKVSSIIGNETVVGVDILKTDNMFRKWTVDVSFLERKKDHQLKIVFKNVFDKEQDKINELGYELPGGNRVHTRKAGFHYGWDWGAKITTLGIWKEVEINAWNDATIREFDIFQKELSDNYAYLDAKIELQVHTAADYFLEINDSIYPYSLTKGKHQLTIPIQFFFLHHCFDWRLTTHRPKYLKRKTTQIDTKKKCFPVFR